MNLIMQRAFSRNPYKTSVLYADCRTKEYDNAQMLNSSVGGLCLETRKPLKPGTSVFIRLKDFSPDPYWPEACECFLGEVRWCEAQNGADTPRYGIGIRLITGTCKHCGQFIEQKSMDVADLCPDCYNRLETVGDEKIREGISNFFFGNVL
ncbi:MAG: PilZ domain-containing protein [Desulfococcaceae bacterium]|nr:PilZ domain-containing protein [Desulfococcaceae bacterium]